jgi:hypothetical protein
MLYVGIAVGLALLGRVVARIRSSRAARRSELALGQRPELLPEGEYAVWQLRRLVAARRPSRISVHGNVVSFAPPDALVPAWAAAASQVRVQVVPASRWVDVARVRLHAPTGSRMTLRVSREARRPLGVLDEPYERRLAGYLALFVEQLRDAGASVERT